MPRLRQDRTTKEWDPGNNFAIHSSPVKDEIGDYCRWHLQIISRLTTLPGFVMGSGVYINAAFPEETADYLKKE
ncbi:MAG: hypothetical protein ACXU9L_12335 [Thermodesulfobacteriota bacterium]